MAARAYGGIAAADRVAARRSRLIEAVLDLVGADGAAAVTVTGVCRRAKLNERYFYESFADRSEALVAAGDHVADVLVAEMLQRLAAAGTEQRARVVAAVGGAVDVLVDDPRMGALFLESASTPVLAERRVALARTFVELMLVEALASLGLERTAAVESWAGFAATHLFGGVLETISAWLRGDLKISQEELVERNVEIFLAVGAWLPPLLEE